MGGSPSACSTLPGGAVTVFICSLKCYLYCKENKKQADAPAALRGRGVQGVTSPVAGSLGHAPVRYGATCADRPCAAQQRRRVSPRMYLSVCKSESPPPAPAPETQAARCPPSACR